MTGINPRNHPMHRAAQAHFTYRAGDYFPAESDEAGFFEWRKSHRVHIGHDVRIGHGAIVLPGRSVGTGAVIAAGVGLVGLLVGGGSMVGSLIAGVTLDRLARCGVPGAWASVFAALLFVPCAVITTTASHAWVALTSLGLWFMSGAAFTSSQRMSLSTADPSQQATIVAWNDSMANTGLAVGTTVLGFVVASGTSFATITGAFGLAALVAAALPLIIKHRGQAAVQIAPGSQR